MLDRGTMYRSYGQKDWNLLKYRYYANSGYGGKGLSPFFDNLVSKFKFLAPVKIYGDMKIRFSNL